MKEEKTLEMVCARCGDFVLPIDDYKNYGKTLGKIYACERCGLSWVRRTDNEKL